MAEPVVLVFPTIQDGTVVRWYRDVDAARYGREMASASRNGVGVNHAPREVALAAYDAHELLRQRGDVEHLETHRRAGFPSGDVVPVGDPAAGERPAPGGSVRVEVDDRFGGAPR